MTAGGSGCSSRAQNPEVVPEATWQRCHVVPPWIHQLFSNLKGWARGVYHALRGRHLQIYLDEFVFRFNRRRTRQAAFRFLFAISLRTNLINYKVLVRPDL